MEEQNVSDSDKAARILRLLTQNHRKIYAYICTLVPSPSDADDVIQETSLVLWRKRQEWDADRDFVPWACGIAFKEVLKLRRRYASRPSSLLSDEVLNQIAIEASDQLWDQEDREEALAACLAKLRSRDRELIKGRYSDSVTTRQFAERLGQPVSTVYKSLARIRAALFDCVEKRMRQSPRMQGL